MPIRFYMDHNVPRAITDGLRTRGVRVITAFEDGRDKEDFFALIEGFYYGAIGNIKATKSISN